MGPLSKPLRLLRRQSEFEEATRRSGGIRAVEEREIDAFREQLKHHPSVVRAIRGAASRLHPFVATLAARRRSATVNCRGPVDRVVARPAPRPVAGALASDSGICAIDAPRPTWRNALRSRRER